MQFGDTIFISSETGNYTVSELMIKKQNFKNVDSGEVVTIGRMKGKILEGEKIYKMSSRALSDSAKQTYSGKELKKLPLEAKLTVKEGQPIVLDVNGKAFVSNLIPERANSSPITKERLIEQLSKTGNTPYEFSNIEIDLGEGLYLPSIRKLNELRRTALEELQEAVRKSYKKKELQLSFDYSHAKRTNNSHKLSVLLNCLSENENYSYLVKADDIYIPYSYFIKMANLVQRLCNKYHVYIYLPNIIQSNMEKKFKKNLEYICENFNINGAVISNISQLSLLPCTFEKIGNYTLNVFNSNTVKELMNLGISRFIVSPELNKQELNELTNSSNLPSEVFVYGNLPLMTMQYCPITHSNHCPENCPKLCEKGNYELKDRLGFRFKIKQDNSQTITTLYNSKTTFIDSSDLSCESVCISFLDENEEEKIKVIDTVLLGNRLEGENYTNGNMSREV